MTHELVEACRAHGLEIQVQNFLQFTIGGGGHVLTLRMSGDSSPAAPLIMIFLYELKDNTIQATAHVVLRGITIEDKITRFRGRSTAPDAVEAVIRAVLPLFDEAWRERLIQRTAWHDQTVIHSNDGPLDQVGGLAVEIDALLERYGVCVGEMMRLRKREKKL